MPYSKGQEVAARIALAAKEGKIPKTKLKGASLSMYKSMSIAQLKDYAKGPIKHVKHQKA